MHEAGTLPQLGNLQVACDKDTTHLGRENCLSVF